MQKLLWKLLGIFGLFLSIGVLSCVGGDRGELPRTQSPTPSELKQSWDDYKVFYRRNLAFIFKFKDDKNIVLDKRWVEITTGDTSAAGKLNDITWVRKIVGQNDQIFGYLVHRASDTAIVKIVDADTIQLFHYHHKEKCCGP